MSHIYSGVVAVHIVSLEGSATCSGTSGGEVVSNPVPPKHIAIILSLYLANISNSSSGIISLSVVDGTSSKVIATDVAAKQAKESFRLDHTVILDEGQSLKGVFSVSSAGDQLVLVARGILLSKECPLCSAMYL